MAAREGMKKGLVFARRDAHPRRWGAIVVMLCAGAVVARSQQTSGQSGTAATASAKETPASSTTQAAADNKVEVFSKDTGATFKLRVNLVQVRVVVRDSKGNLVDGLKREDFQIYDQGKLQTISTFDIETAKSRQELAEAATKTQQLTETGETPVSEKVVMPERFVALVFDDIHLQMDDATFVRTSAKALIDSMTPTDRMAIFGTSGQLSQDFTSDKDALENTLLRVIPRPKMGKINGVTNCPDVTHFMADEAINKNNEQILSVVTQETLQCQYGGDPHQMIAAAATAQAALQQELTAGDTDNDFTYRALEDIIRRMSGLPGERVMVLASPGFLLTTRFLDESGIIDRANRANLVINTIDARGLYTPDILGDISQRNTDTVQTAGFKAQYRNQEQLENQFVLGDFAYGTGGAFFHNSNDLAGGLKRAGAAPEISYMLGFSPLNPKMDGKYHNIKVVLTSKGKYDIQARRGYYALKKAEDPQEEAKQEIAEAVFSQEEIHELPLDLQTQYFKTGNEEAHLSVVSRIDVKGVHFRKADGRNFDNLTVATVIFDENGNYVTGGEKLLEMRLLDATYERMSRTGLTMKSSFDLKPGKYLIRQVVRDSEGAQMAARNGAVVIPY